VGAALAPSHLLFFTNRLLTTLLTADSTKTMEMIFPCRYYNGRRSSG
jgi:hypothetical protein